jgi:putative peptide maturation dehydrogenase
MQRVRRPAYLFFRITDDLLPDIGRLLRGEVELVPTTRLVAFSALTGRELGITPDELRLLSELSATSWTDVADLELGGQPVEPKVLKKLAAAGIVVADGPDELTESLRDLDERLTEIGWDPHAALYHAHAKWRDVDLKEMPVAVAPDARSGPAPPGPFHALPHAQEVVDLQLERPDDGVFRLLTERRTTRALDPEASLTREELSLLLYYTFGCQGYVDLGDGLVVLKKTSPSGGSLHPIEAYPLVVGVERVAPGLYHYRADRHALELLVPLERAAAREQLVAFAAGQTYLAAASVLVVLTARFSRSFWKYRHPRGYAVLMLDAGHLSQTLYLIAAELGLGAFVSAAVNSGNVEDAIGLDGFEEGVLAACGVGRPTGRRSPFDPAFEHYLPRETVLAPP